MPAWVIDILINIAANFIFWLGGGSIVWFLLSRKRRRLHRFFGIRKRNPLVVYLSSLIIEPNTIKSREGVVSSYTGLAISDYEFQVIPQLTTLFTSTRLVDIPDMFSGFIDSLWLVQRPVVDFRLSPPTIDDLQFTDLISVGGTKFNVVTRYYLKTGAPLYVLNETEDKWIIDVKRGKQAQAQTKTEFSKYEVDVGVLLKMRDIENKTTAFIVEGGGVNATRATVEYLVHNWDKLLQRYSDREFGIVLKCPLFEDDKEGYKNWEVIKESPD